MGSSWFSVSVPLPVGGRQLRGRGEDQQLRRRGEDSGCGGGHWLQGG